MKRKGFTLIELMVVMSVIMLLAAFVVASMKTNRENAMDVRTITALDQVRVVSELIRAREGGYASVCNEEEMRLGSISELVDLQEEIDLNAGKDELECCVIDTKTTHEYCVSVRLKSGDYWCVTSDGKSGKSTDHCGPDARCPRL